MAPECGGIRSRNILRTKYLAAMQLTGPHAVIQVSQAFPQPLPPYVSPSETNRCQHKISVQHTQDLVLVAYFVELSRALDYSSNVPSNRDSYKRYVRYCRRPDLGFLAFTINSETESCAGWREKKSCQCARGVGRQSFLPLHKGGNLEHSGIHVESEAVNHNSQRFGAWFIVFHGGVGSYFQLCSPCAALLLPQVALVLTRVHFSAFNMIGGTRDGDQHPLWRTIVPIKVRLVFSGNWCSEIPSTALMVTG